MVRAYVSYAGKKVRIRVSSTWEQFLSDLKQKFNLNPEESIILLDHDGMCAMYVQLENVASRFIVRKYRA